MQRRKFIHCSLCAGASAWLAACGSPQTDPDAALRDAGGSDGGPVPSDGGRVDAHEVQDAGDAGTGCDDAFAGGTLLGVVPFSGEDLPLNTLRGEGWDGRLYTDLSVLSEGSLLIPNENFYVRTRYPDLLVPPATWEIQVGGLVDAPSVLTLEQLRPFVRDQGMHVLECSGNGRRGGFGLMSAAQWAGSPVMEVFDALLSPLRAATRVLIGGFDMHSVPSAGDHSTPGAQWVFSFEQLRDAGAFFATEMNGVPLPPDHGEPVRLYVPGWYGCTNIKWVDELRFVDDSEPATSQMIEFASRTHQIGTPTLASEYLPATMDQAAMPVRIERWSVGGRTRYRVIGVMWGGYETTSALTFSTGRAPPTRVDVCPAQTQNQLWTLWQHAWEPTERGEHRIVMNVDDPAIPTRRLDMGYYARTVDIAEV